MTKSRQTQTYLQNLFASRGIAPRHRYGQNFLIDLNLHEVIERAAEITPVDVILEVGPGAGALTTLLAEKASAVIAVEIDESMAELTREAVSGRANVRVLTADALARKHAVNPQVLDNVRAGLAVAPDRVFKIVANLPYNVATPLISNFLVHAELQPALMVVTIQLELAERLRAEPTTEAYGALTALVQALADVEIVRTLSPKVFWPRPKVGSAVVKITPSASKLAAVGDLPWYHSTIRRIFQHRRKNLRGVLYALWRDRWTKPEIDAFLDDLGLVGQVRAEAMNVEELIALAAALKQRFGNDPDSFADCDDEDAEHDAADGEDPSASAGASPS
jgi:16S rRNA (adenine1518-N6/adenine1519-N6)-dimethyltransferase